MAIVDVAVCVGQSQMLGTPGNEGVLVPLTATIPTTNPSLCWDWDGSANSVIQQLVEPHSHQNGFSPQKSSMLPTFSNLYTAASGRPLLVVRSAKGGTPLLHENAPGNQHWDTAANGGALFAQSVTRTKAAMTALTGAGHTIGTIFVLWSQGYKDAIMGNALARYGDANAALVARYRDPTTGFDRSDLQVYTEENYCPQKSIGTADEDACNLIRDLQIAAVAATDGLHIAFNGGKDFSTANQTVAPDELHDSQKGLQIMGAGFATYVAEDQGWTAVEPEDPDPNPNYQPTSYIAHRLMLIEPYVYIPPEVGDPAAFVSSSGAGVSSGVTTVSPAVPSGTGGKIIALCGANNTNVTWTAPNGSWTAITDATNSPTGQAAFIYTADPGDSGTFTFTRSAGLSGAAVVLVRITDAGAVNAASKFSGSGDITHPTITSTEDNSYILQIQLRLVSGASSWAGPGGDTVERADASTSGTAYTYSVGDEVKTTAGSVGTRFWDNSTTGAVKGIMLSISPPAV